LKIPFFSFVGNVMEIIKYLTNLWHSCISFPVPWYRQARPAQSRRCCSGSRSLSRTAVNFTNILRAAFEQIFFWKKNYKAKLSLEKSCVKHFWAKKLWVKCWWNWHLGAADVRTDGTFTAGTLDRGVANADGLVEGLKKVFKLSCYMIQ